jgi:hypothetical protein
MKKIDISVKKIDIGVVIAEIVKGVEMFIEIEILTEKWILTIIKIVIGKQLMIATEVEVEILTVVVILAKKETIKAVGIDI